MALTLETLLEARNRIREAAESLSPFEKLLRTAGAVRLGYVRYRVSDLVKPKDKEGAPFFYAVPNLGALVTHPDNAAYLRKCISDYGYIPIEIESVRDGKATPPLQES